MRTQSDGKRLVNTVAGALRREAGHQPIPRRIGRIDPEPAGQRGPLDELPRAGQFGRPVRSLRRNRRDDDRLRRALDQTAKAGEENRGRDNQVIADRPDEVGFQHRAIVDRAMVATAACGLVQQLSTSAMLPPKRQRSIAGSQMATSKRLR